MTTRKTTLLTEAELQKLTTPRLLAYQAMLRKAPEGESFWHPDTTGGREWHKGTAMYAEYMSTLRGMLSKREHVPRKKR